MRAYLDTNTNINPAISFRVFKHPGLDSFRISCRAGICGQQGSCTWALSHQSPVDRARPTHFARATFGPRGADCIGLQAIYLAASNAQMGEEQAQRFMTMPNVNLGCFYIFHSH